MTAFVIIAALMVVTALAWVIVPLLRRNKTDGVAREAANLSILRDQLAELDADVANGTITQEHHDHARRELEQRVLEDTAPPPATDSSPPPFAGAWTAAIAASALPIAAALMYAILGNHEAFFPVSRVNADVAQHDITPEKVEAMVAKLVARLAKEPDNVEGWSVLAHTYYAMNRLPEAVGAYEQAVKREPDNANLLADYADALAASQKSLEGKPLELVARALKSDPTQWKALALAGTAAFDRKDFKLALDYWEKLKVTLPPESELSRSLDASIAEARAAGGIAASAAPPVPFPAIGGATMAAASAPAAKAAAPVPSASLAAPSASLTVPSSPNSSAAATSVAAAAGAAIAGTVNLSPALTAQAAPTDTVYIFARAAQGPKMPLAILRKQVKDLPVTFSLDDSMAMMPEMKISNFGEVVVGARVSKTGSATPQSGDLEGFSKPVKLGAYGVAIVIDTARP